MLIQLLKNKNWKVRFEVVLAMGIKRKSKELKKLINDPSGNVKKAVVYVLAKLGNKDAKKLWKKIEKISPLALSLNSEKNKVEKDMRNVPAIDLAFMRLYIDGLQFDIKYNIHPVLYEKIYLNSYSKIKNLS